MGLVGAERGRLRWAMAALVGRELDRSFLTEIVQLAPTPAQASEEVRAA